MKMMRHFGVAAGCVGLLVAGMGCRSAGTAGSVGGVPLDVPHRVVETTREGDRYTNAPNRVMKVDAHSVLTIEFPRIADTPPEPLSQDWKRLHSVLQFLNARAEEWQALNATRIDARDAAAVARRRADLRQLDAKAAAIVADLGNLGLASEEVVAILVGTSPSVAVRSPNGYVNLAQWATNQWGTLRARAERYEREIAERRGISVTVQAFRDSLSGGRSVLHVENWDGFEEGVYSPIDRTGLRPTEAEQKRLEMARQAAEEAVALVNSARTNKAGMASVFRSGLSDFKGQLDALRSGIERLRQGWSADEFKGVQSELDRLAQSDVEAIRQSADLVRTNVAVLGQSLAALHDGVQGLSRIGSGIEGAERDPLRLMFGPGGIGQALDSGVRSVTNAVELIRGWPAAVAELREHLPRLQASLSELTSTWLETLASELTVELQARFGLEASMLAKYWEALSASNGAAEAMDIVAGAEGVVIRPVDRLIDGRVDLKMAGLALDDLVSIKIRATNAVHGGVAGTYDYQHEVGFLGWHGKPAVHFIMARGLSGGEASEWQPNVAAGVEFHFTHREPRPGGERFWNWVDPAVGFHLASLDQGEDNFEIGAGGTVSFKDGLLSGGYGYNFSASDPYVWVGINLISALTKAKNTFAK